ncbi:hypothetical protein LI325_06985 [Enterocloster lavalensis]|nr:hypothetical protein [Enterocloster lavalensis]
MKLIKYVPPYGFSLQKSGVIDFGHIITATGDGVNKNCIFCIKYVTNTCDFVVFTVQNALWKSARNVAKICTKQKTTY